MTNYDYNKGYRGFRFKKDDKIDQNLPALKTYLSVRETSSVHWITSKMRVLHTDSTEMRAWRRDLYLDQDSDMTKSIVYFPRIGTTIGSNIRINTSHIHDEDSMEGFLDRYALAPMNTAATKSLRGASVVGSHMETIRTPHKVLRNDVKSRKQNNRTKKLKQVKQDSEMHHKLEKCLIIQNGVERNSRKQLLSKEKTEDIIEWIDKMHV